MAELAKWDEDRWIAACKHILTCDQQVDCRFCERIKEQIDAENADAGGR
jgi:hypothetical protein